MNEYTLRPLCAADIFPMATIISKIGLKEFTSAIEGDAITALINENGNNAKAAAAKVGVGVAVNMADVLFANLPKVEKDIFRFLSNLSGMTVQDVAKLPLPVFAQMVIDTVQKDEFKDFMKVVSRLFKSAN